MAAVTSKKTEDGEGPMAEYFEELREWEKEAKMKASMIKKETVLEAFEQVNQPVMIRLRSR